MARAQRYHRPEAFKTPTTSRFVVGDQIAYAKAFLRNIATPSTDDSWRRRGVVVAIGGEVTPLIRHWKTGAPGMVGAEFILVQWNDETYPRTYDDGERQYAEMVRNSAIAKVGSAKFAEDIA